MTLTKYRCKKEIAHQASPAHPKWVTFFQFALTYDREDTSRVLGKMINDRQCKERMLSLAGNHLYSVQNILQTVSPQYSLRGFRLICANCSSSVVDARILESSCPYFTSW